MVIHREAGFGELYGAPVAYLDEGQALLVEQDQVYFATTTTKVTRDGSQTPVDEVTKRELFGVIA